MTSNHDRFNEFVRRYAGDFDQRVKRYVRDPNDGDDIIQRAYMSIWHHFETDLSESRGSPRSWCCTILKNEAMNHHRRSSSRKHRLMFGGCAPEHTLDVVADSRTTTPLEALVAEEDRSEAEVLKKARWQLINEARMSAADREALDAVYVKGITHREAAERLGIKPAAHRSRLCRALNCIRDHIASNMN